MGDLANAGAGRIYTIQWLGCKLKDVAKCLGRDVATVSSLVSRFAVRMGEKPNVEEAGCSSTGRLSGIESQPPRLMQKKIWAKFSYTETLD